MRERDIRRALDLRVKALGGSTRALSWLGRAHAPDVLVLLAGTHALVETKRPGETARAGQAREHARLRAAGFRVLLVNCVEDLDREFPL